MGFQMLLNSLLEVNNNERKVVVIPYFYCLKLNVCLTVYQYSHPAISFIFIFCVVLLSMYPNHLVDHQLSTVHHLCTLRLMSLYF